MATVEREIISPKERFGSPNKESILRSGWFTFVDGLLIKATEAMKKTDGSNIFSKDSVGIFGFVFLKTENGYKSQIRPIMICANDQGSILFSCSHGEVNDEYVLGEEAINIHIRWSEKRDTWIGRQVNYPLLGEEAIDKFLDGKKVEKGFVFFETVCHFFFAGIEEKSFSERISIIRDVKKFCQMVSPAVYETKCARFFSRVK